LLEHHRKVAVVIVHLRPQLVLQVSPEPTIFALFLHGLLLRPILGVEHFVGDGIPVFVRILDSVSFLVAEDHEGLGKVDPMDIVKQL